MLIGLCFGNSTIFCIGVGEHYVRWRDLDHPMVDRGGVPFLFGFPEPFCDRKLEMGGRGARRYRD